VILAEFTGSEVEKVRRELQVILVSSKTGEDRAMLVSEAAQPRYDQKPESEKYRKDVWPEPSRGVSASSRRWLTLCLLPAGRCFGVSISGLSSHLLAFEFLSQFTLEPLLFAGFQKKGVLLEFFENALLLNLSLETPKGALNGFAVENPDFCQTVPP
jgi:hypothetical protein